MDNIYELLGIESCKEERHSLESDLIPFSKYDFCYRTITKYKNGYESIYDKVPVLHSPFFQEVFEILSDFGYNVDINHSPDNTWLYKEYRFIHKEWDIPTLYVSVNPYHYDWAQIWSHNINKRFEKINFKKELFISLEYVFKKNKNASRHLKLKELLEC